MGKRARKGREQALQQQNGKTDGKGSGKQGEEFSPADKRFASTLNYLARGVILGGSLAVMAGWLIPEANMGRMLGLGLLAGCLAGVTMKNINDRKQGR
ncbi:MAG: hypothetical protein KKF77_06870 [Proteobacteria bacterium]|nr:hypothetical protein [Pseudomonadota bacterium]